MNIIESFFRLRENRTSFRVEFIGGATTFATMAYIIVVNPAILQFAGLPIGPSTVATILVATVGSVMMGLYANRPIAVAPYMGENAFIAFGLAALGIGWQLRLGAVFVSGVIFLIITLLRVRSWLASALSPSMKQSFAAGIGLFLAFIGLYQSGIVTSFVEGIPVPPDMTTIPRPNVPVKLGNLKDTRVLLAIGGFLVTRGQFAVCLLADICVCESCGLSAPVRLSRTSLEEAIQPIILAQDRGPQLKNRLGTVRTVPKLLPALDPSVELAHQ